MIGQWFDGTAPQGSLVHHDDGGGFSVELGKGFANEFPIRVVCQVLGFPDEARSRRDDGRDVRGRVRDHH